MDGYSYEVWNGKLFNNLEVVPFTWANKFPVNQLVILELDAWSVIFLNKIQIKSELTQKQGIYIFF